MYGLKISSVSNLIVLAPYICRRPWQKYAQTRVEIIDDAGSHDVIASRSNYPSFKRKEIVTPHYFKCTVNKIQRTLMG